MYLSKIQAKRLNLDRNLTWGTVLSLNKGTPLVNTPCNSPRSLRGQSNESGHLLPWSPPAKTLARSIVEKAVNPPERPVIYSQKRRSLRMQPPNQPVGVFVRPTFPGVVWPGKINSHTRISFKNLVPGELLAIVQRHRPLEYFRQRIQQIRYRLNYLLSLLADHSICKRKSGFPLHQRYQMPRALGTVNQITFPMPHSLPQIHLRWPQINHFLVRDPAATPSINFRTTPPPFAVRSGKLLPQIPPLLAVQVNMLVDRLLANRGTPLQPGPPADHLRRPTLSQASLRVLSNFVSKSPRSSSPCPPLGLLMRLLGPVTSFAGVPLNLSTYTACTSSQKFANILYSDSFSTPLINQSTLFSAHTFVSHYFDLLWGYKEIDSLPYGRCFFS